MAQQGAVQEATRWLLQHGYLLLLAANVGAVIMPWMIFYQLSAVVDTEPVEQLSSWLFRVSRNRIIDKKRKQTTQSLEDLAYEDAAAALSAAAITASTQYLPPPVLIEEVIPADSQPQWRRQPPSAGNK